jgi:hypothetical protein
MTAPTILHQPDPLQLGMLACSTDAHTQALARAAQPGYYAWLAHVQPAAGCTRPIRLAGTMTTIERETGRLLTAQDTANMPDGVIYKPCGNRRASVCPSCSQTYKRDAYQLLRAGLVGGKSVPETVATHPAVFPTFTAPSFGPVHTRNVDRHTCEDRRQCDCRPDVCYPRRAEQAECPHGARLMCFARHELGDSRIGTPLCLDCYDYDAQAVWNSQAGELWRRTRIAIERYLRRAAKERGVNPKAIRLSYGKVAEMQRRAVVHFHAIVRLDGYHPDDPDTVLPPPPGLYADDLVAAVAYAAAVTGFTSPGHPKRPEGWRIAWGDQLKTKVITVGVDGEVTDGMVAAYLAKYATKSTEETGHVSRPLTEETVNVYADPDGTHTERLIEACWMLGRPKDWRGLRRWAHMLGYGGHFLTKSRRYSVPFRYLREQRIRFRRASTTGPETTVDQDQEETLVVNFLQFVGAGWHTTGDALLANTSAAMARARQEAARDAMAN